ncbi:MAG TPA: class I SAM-dependent methyltransferase, partial [Vicinamibacteria bacterium]|nr:class I SAM-dependent methyltransferase [Vicinamibacteria bacterium]
QRGLDVLDLACGSGEPALEEARRVGPKGTVHGLDPSEPVVALAREYAQAEGLRQAVFSTGSAEKLPYDDGSFDRVTSRFGPMYFTDLPKAVSESFRALRPGGRLAWLVWGPIEQPFWRATAAVVLRHAGLSRFPPEALQPFCFGEGGILSRAISRGGFVNVREDPKEVVWSWPGPPEEVSSMFFAGAPPFQGILDSLDSESRARAEQEVTESLRTYYSNGQVSVPESVILATGHRGGHT